MKSLDVSRPASVQSADRPARDRARKAGRANKTDFRGFIKDAPVPIAMLDREMRYLAANRLWLETIRRGEGDVIGRSLYEVAPDTPRLWRDLYRRGLAGETLRADQDRLERPDGRTEWARWEVRPWHDSRGTIGGIVIRLENVTAKVEAEEKFRKKAEALSRLHDAGWRLRQARSLRDGLDELLLATIDLLGAKMGNIQLFDRAGKVLRFAAHHGFKQDFLEFFREVSADDDTACGRALRTGKPVVIEDVESDMSFEEFRAIRRAAGYRAVISAPLVNPRGKVLGMLSVHFGSPHRPSDMDLELLSLYLRRTADFIERFRSEEALRESEERLRLALAGNRIALFDWDRRTGAYVWNDETYRLFGYRVGEIVPSRAAWAARVHPDDLEVALTMAERTMREQSDYLNEYRIIHPGGDVHWLRSRGRFLYDKDEPVRLIGLVEDVTEARQQVETQRVMVAELQHRTRNLMAVVHSIAHQTLSTAASLQDFEERFDRRLRALSRVQGLLSHPSNDVITLGALVVMELEAIGSEAFADRISFGGPRVPLRKSAVEILALAIHELATNALKHGALASDAGHLSVVWRTTGKGAKRELDFEWVERGIAADGADASRRGYGRVLIEEALPYSLSAQAKFELERSTLRCVISLPLTTTGAGEIAG
ncbi:MAG TPA: PAS domain S-box protein [Stellaceae bacterium]|nr:PAS domain S-box protein [Stellaceae bacterium]